jgi:hypothetical protein
MISGMTETAEPMMTSGYRSASPAPLPRNVYRPRVVAGHDHRHRHTGDDVGQGVHHHGPVGDDGDGLDRLIGEPLQRLGQVQGGAALPAGQVDPISGTLCRVLHAAQDARQLVQLGPGEHHAERRGSAALESAGDAVAAIAELLDGGLDASPCLRTDRRVVVEHAGHGDVRHAGFACRIHHAWCPGHVNRSYPLIVLPGPI